MNEEDDIQRGYMITRITQLVSSRAGTKSLSLQTFRLVISLETQRILEDKVPDMLA